MRLVQELEKHGQLHVVRSNKNNRYIVIMDRNNDAINNVLKMRKEASSDKLSRENLTRDKDVTSTGDKDVTSIGDKDVTLIITEPSIEPSIRGEKTSPNGDQSKNRVREALEIKFSTVTGLKRPKTSTQSQKKSAGSLWWNPLREIAELCEWDTARAISLIDTTVDKLKDGGMTISSPKSILNTARALTANGNASGSIQLF